MQIARILNSLLTPLRLILNVVLLPFSELYDSFKKNNFFIWLLKAPFVFIFGVLSAIATGNLMIVVYAVFIALMDNVLYASILWYIFVIIFMEFYNLVESKRESKIIAKLLEQTQEDEQVEDKPIPPISSPIKTGVVTILHKFIMPLVRVYNVATLPFNMLYDSFKEDNSPLWLLKAPFIFISSLYSALILGGRMIMVYVILAALIDNMLYVIILWYVFELFYIDLYILIQSKRIEKRTFDFTEEEIEWKPPVPQSVKPEEPIQQAEPMLPLEEDPQRAQKKMTYAEFKKQQQAVNDEPIVRRGRGKK